MKLAYTAFDQMGRAVTDQIEAVNATEAGDLLRRRGLFVTKIGGSSSATQTTKVHRGPVTGRTRRLKQIQVFTRQLYVLVASGTCIVEAMETIELQVKDYVWRGVIGDVRRNVEEGLSLAEAMAAHPHYFDAITRNLIAAGESTGKMPAMLERLSVLIQKQVQVRCTLVGAMIYPALLMVISVVVLVAMMFFVLPNFAGMFANLDVALPPTTRFLVALSDLMRGYWWALIVASIGVVVGAYVWCGTPSGKILIDTLILKIPYMRIIMRDFMTARIARLLGLLLGSHLPLLEVLGLIRQTTVNCHYQQLVVNAEDAVTRGNPISAVFGRSDLITPSVRQVVKSGEHSGQVGPLLLNMADLMDEENDMFVKSITGIIEPIILVVLGLLVGFVAISMFLPLFDLMGGATGAPVG
tara:strand:- start:157 stop:1389 length:1233 start_codon:yes stop_codon:yes gene_type:complete